MVAKQAARIDKPVDSTRCGNSFAHASHGIRRQRAHDPGPARHRTLGTTERYRHVAASISSGGRRIHSTAAGDAARGKTVAATGGRRPELAAILRGARAASQRLTATGRRAIRDIVL